MARTALTSITAEHIDAANALHKEAPDVVGALVAAVRQAARKVTDLDRDDVAALAAIYAPDLLNTDRDNLTQAAAVATRRACAVLRNETTDAASLDAVTDERGEPLLRLASPWTPNPAAPYTTTDADRHADALDLLDTDDERQTVAALLPLVVTVKDDNDNKLHTFKGNKIPVGAVRQARGIPTPSGRKTAAANAALADEVRQTLTDYRDARALVLTLHASGAEAWQPIRYGRPVAPRQVDDAARLADRTAKQRPAEDARRKENATPTSGAATVAVTVNRRTLDRLGILVDGRRQRADVARLVDGARSLARTLPTSQPAWHAGTERAERQDFDYAAAAEAARGRRLPGVSVDSTGALVAPSGVSGAGAGTGKAAPRHQAPRKASRTGGTGATIPTGPRR